MWPTSGLGGRRRRAVRKPSSSFLRGRRNGVGSGRESGSTCLSKRVWRKNLLLVSERATLGFQPGLLAGSDGRVVAAWDVPAEDAAKSRPLADAVRWAAASQPCWVIQAAHETHGASLRQHDGIPIGGFGAKVMASFRALSAREPLDRGTGRASDSLTDHPALVVHDRSGALTAACLRRPTLGSRGCALQPGLVPVVAPAGR